METGRIGGNESFVMIPCVSVVRLNDCTDIKLTKRSISKTDLVIYLKI